MNIVSQVSECFDDLVKSSKKAAKEFIVKRLEILDRDIYLKVDKKRFELIRINERTILTTAGIITYKRRYYYDNVNGDYIYLLDNQLQIPKHIRMSNELIIKIMDLASTLTYREVGKHLSDEFVLSKFTIWKVIKETNIELINPPKINIGKNMVHVQVDEKYTNINPSKKRSEKHNSKNKKRYYTATIFAGKEPIGNKGKNKLLNKTYISSASLEDLKRRINETLRKRYHRTIRSEIYLSGDLATYIQNMPESIKVCKASYVPDKFHVIRDLRKIIGDEFNESWLYDPEKLATIVIKLKESDSYNAPKLRKLIIRNPGIFETYKKKDYLGCSQEGQNSHVYAVRFGKYANRFLKETIEKLSLIREASVTGSDIQISHKNRELPTKEFFEEITYDFSEKQKYDIDLTNMKYETQKMFKKLIYGGL